MWNNYTSNKIIEINKNIKVNLYHKDINQTSILNN